MGHQAVSLMVTGRIKVPGQGLEFPPHKVFIHLLGCFKAILPNLCHGAWKLEAALSWKQLNYSCPALLTA